MKKLMLCLALLAASGIGASAQMPVRIGVRAGVNTSNFGETRAGADAVNGFRKSEWKPGFLVGAVVDIPMASFFALQPGFFYDYRRSTYETMGDFSYVPAPGEPEATIGRRTAGTLATSWFHIPVLFSFRYAPLENLQLQADFGPYLSVGIGGSDTYSVTDYSGPLPVNDNAPKVSEPAFGKGDARYFRGDWGFKMGVGLEICKHYYVGVHYLAGVRNMARNKAVVRNADTRAWQFALGYNF